MPSVPSIEGWRKIWCQSCREEYIQDDAGTCRECYEEASETEEELKREIDDLKAKIAFIRLQPPSPLSPSLSLSSSIHPLLSSSVAAAAPELILLHAASTHVSSPDDLSAAAFVTLAVPAHRVVLVRVSRSPVFKAMLENDMEESKSGIIRIYDVSYDVLRLFVQYLHTGEALIDEQMACDLLVLAEKYQVKHLKIFCEKFMTSMVNSDNAIASYAFAHQHNAKQLQEAALSLIIDNMATLTEREEYKELVEKDPRIIVEIYEAYLARQINTATKDPKHH